MLSVTITSFKYGQGKKWVSRKPEEVEARRENSWKRKEMGGCTKQWEAALQAPTEQQRADDPALQIFPCSVV